MLWNKRLLKIGSNAWSIGIFRLMDSFWLPFKTISFDILSQVAKVFTFLGTSWLFKPLKHQDLEKVLSSGSSCAILKRSLFFFGNLEILERKKLGLFEKVTSKFKAHAFFFFFWEMTQRPNAPSPNTFFFLFSFFERFGNLDFFFWIFF